MMRTTQKPGPRRALGFMTGTSLDAIDAAVIEVAGRGLSMRVSVVGCAAEPIGPEREPLRAAAAGEPMALRDLVGAVHALSRRHADLARRMVREHGSVDLVAVHGQTLVHAPPINMQAIEPWLIGRAAGAPVVFDLRAADLAAGGRGAPITPIADWILFRSSKLTRAIVNLGGFCNVTTLPRDAGVESTAGADVCACNQILDAVARRGLKAAIDVDGRSAQRGEANSQAERELTGALARQRGDGRSLGTGDEAGAWVDLWLERLEPGDVAASAVCAIGAVIGHAVAEVDEVYLAGGGCHNHPLVGAIEQAAGTPMRRCDDLGVPATHREAVAMGVLGCLCADGLAITLPRATGVASPAPIAGSWANLTPDTLRI